MAEKVISELQVSNNKEKEPVEVKKLHFLIHPGFGIEHAEKSLQKDYVALLLKYENYLKTLPQDELAVIFKELVTFRKRGYERESISDKWREYKKSTAEEREFKKTMRAEGLLPEREWTEFIDKIRQELGARVLVLGGEYDIFNIGSDTGIKKTINAIQKIARARGFTIPNNIPMVVFGEYYNACVKAASEGLGRGFNKARLPIIENLTDEDIFKNRLLKLFSSYKTYSRKDEENEED